jgi:Putative metallopeptidase
MKSLRHAPVFVAALFALASGPATVVQAQSPSVPGTIADNDAVFVDGKSFKILPGKARGDTAAEIKALGARDLGPGAIIFRSAERLYIVDTPLFLPGSGPAGRRDVLVDADRAKTNRVQIEYAPPKNPELQKIYDLIKERQVLETLQQMFSPFRLPVELTIKTLDCNGMVNSWYNTDDSIPTVHVCYELLQDILRTMPEGADASGTTPHDVVVGQFLFWVLHELGHAMFDIFQVPLFGREEDAADQFAGYIMLQFGRDQAHRWVIGAAYAANAYMKDYKENPKVEKTLEKYSSVHGLPEQRYYNLMCLAYGSDPRLFADVLEQGFLPKARARNCEYEYETFRRSFAREIRPHIDRQMARAVLDSTWFAEQPSRPLPR